MSKQPIELSIVNIGPLSNMLLPYVTLDTYKH